MTGAIANPTCGSLVDGRPLTTRISPLALPDDNHA